MTDAPFTTVAYSEADAADLSLDVFRPAVNSRRSAVLLFHGGGWRTGSKETVHPQAVALAAEGFTFDLAPSMLAATVRATVSFLERAVTRRPELDEEAHQFAFARLLRAREHAEAP